MITVVVSLIAGLVTLIYGIGLVWPEIADGYAHTIFILFPVIIPLGEISGAGLQMYYIFIVLAIIISAIALFAKSYGGFSKELMGRGRLRDHSPFFEMCGLLFAVLFFNMAIVYVMMLFGYEPDVPTEEMDVWEMLLVLANASVWEEIITRVMLIGVPLLLYDLMTYKVERKVHSYLLGGGFTFGASEVILVVVSSLLFGFAHFDAWGAWKIAPTTIAGIAFGYLFLKFGLYASIMLHFAIDYFSMPMEVSQSFTIEALTILAMLIWVVMGVGFFIYYVIRVAEYFTNNKFLEPSPTVVAVGGFYPGPYAPAQITAPPPYYGPPPPVQPYQAPPPQAWRGGVYVCPSCGHTEARWVDGRFQCLECGHLS